MDEHQLDAEYADSEPERRSGPWKLIALVIAITLIGVWFVPGKFVDQTDEIANDALQPSLLDKLPPTGAGGEPKLPEALQPIEIDDSPGARARTLIADMRSRGNIQLEALFTAAEKARGDGQLADAYLLHFFAAREGYAPSALILGEQADPVSRDPNNSLFEAADLNQAHKWYLAAADSGDADARQRLDALRRRVEQRAADGDPQARRIALQWQ